MMSSPRITMCQIDPTVGDITGNSALIATTYDQVASDDVDIAAFPECCVIGYPVEDLVLHPSFRRAAMEAVHQLAACTRGQHTALLIGCLWEDDQGDCYNAALLLADGIIQAIRYKYQLPNEGVFDEKRVFTPAGAPNITRWKDWRLGIMICADLWTDDVTQHFAQEPLDALIVLNASPYEQDKHATRLALAARTAHACNAPLYYVNQTGGQDELVFDGGSFVMNAQGKPEAHYAFFRTACTAATQDALACDAQHLHYRAMTEGLRAYVNKNGFSSVVIGLSGGIDSALTAIIAADALGADRVHCVMMPSPYTATISLDDAKELAERLGVHYDILPIDASMQAMHNTLSPLAPEVPSALALENIQSRLRGVMLMAVSNSTGALLVTTGNKSEMATGYATLYGDMCGAYSVLKDVYKTDVFALSRWRNIHIPQESLCAVACPMPERIITRPPSAELRDDQRDDDSLPPYDMLDDILKQLIEARKSVQEIVAAGHKQETVEQVLNLLRRAEYKRRQAPPGVKLTSMSFGRDRRMPLTNRFADN